MDAATAAGLREQIVFVRDHECLPTIVRMKSLLQEASHDPEIKRLMVVPILYSVWERAFSVWTAICLKVAQHQYTTARDCPPALRAFWLRKADFFKSFVDSVRDVMELEREDNQLPQTAKKITKGGFHLSMQVLTKLDEWHDLPLSAKGSTESLVITYSNVNEAVVATNAGAIGLMELPSFAQLDLTRLSELVGIRNSIGHGGVLNSPGAMQVGELIEYTERLIIQYAVIVNDWIDKAEAP